MHACNNRNAPNHHNQIAPCFSLQPTSSSCTDSVSLYCILTFLHYSPSNLTGNKKAPRSRVISHAIDGFERRRYSQRVVAVLGQVIDSAE